MRTRPALYITALCLASVPLTATAHDANLARWDIRTRGDELVVELRTSQSALHQSLCAASPEVERGSYDSATYEALLSQLLMSAIRPEEDHTELASRAVSVHLGHESVVTMVFSRQHDGPPSGLRVDLRRFSSRPNQHHLVYVHATDGRQRVMLRPVDEHVLRWSAASGITRASARGPR